MNDINKINEICELFNYNCLTTENFKIYSKKELNDEPNCANYDIENQDDK